MAQQREKFAPNVPAWIKRVVKRWKRIFNLNDWVVSVFLANDETLGRYDGEQVEAFNRVNVPYRSSNIHINENIKDTAVGRATVVHEVRHIIYEPLSDMINLLIDRYVPEADRKLVKKPFDEAFESLIEQDIFAFEQLTEL